MSEAAPGLSAEKRGAYFARVEVSGLLRYAVDEHLRVGHLLFEPLTGDDVTALNAVLGRVRDHMRAAPPRSAKPRARRNQTG